MTWRASTDPRVEVDRPRATAFVPRHPRDPSVERDVAAKVEAVGDVLEVPERLRLCSEVLAPLPLVEQLG